MLAVVGSVDYPTMEAIRVVRVSEGEWLTESLFETFLPPLAGGDAEPASFVF